MKYEDYLFCSECGSLRDLASGEGSKLVCLVCRAKTPLAGTVYVANAITTARI